jgi:transposase-like protein
MWPCPLWRFARHQRGRWLNNRVEQDHRRIKRLTRPMLGFHGLWMAQRSFVHQIFGLTA